MLAARIGLRLALVLCFLHVQTFAYFEELPAIGAINESSPGAMARPLSQLSADNASLTADTDPPRPRYRRVAPGNWEENERLYQFLIDCVRDPGYAASVTEVIVDDMPAELRLLHCNWGDERKFDDELKVETEKALSAAARDSPFRDFVRQMGIHDMEAWLVALAWMDPSVVETRKKYAKPASDFRSPFSRNNEKRNFMLHASMLVLALCPNIESMILLGYRGPSANYHNKGIPIDNFLRLNNWDKMPARYLQKLQDVTIYPEEFMDSRDFATMDPITVTTRFHRLPSIRTVHFHGMEEAFREEYVDRWPPGTANYSALRFTNCGFHPHISFALIRMSRRLESLQLHLGGRGHSDSSSGAVEMDTLYRALVGHKDSLTELDIMMLDEDYAYSGNSNYLPADSPFSPHYQRYFQSESSPSLSPEEMQKVVEEVTEGTGFESAVEKEHFAADQAASLKPDELFPFQMHSPGTYADTLLDWPKQFVALKRLSIPVGTLLGRKQVKGWGDDADRLISTSMPFSLVDALPDGLEYLHIRNYVYGVDEKWDNQIDELLSEKAKKLPALGTVLLTGDVPLEMDPERSDNVEPVLLGELGRTWVEV